MQATRGISRRRLLEIVGAAGGFRARRRGQRRVGAGHENASSGWRSWMPLSTRHNRSASWPPASAATSARPKVRCGSPESRHLLFNDIHTSRRLKYTPGQGVVVAKTTTNEANGLTRDLQGRLISAEHATRRVTREDPDGSITVVANSFQGKRLLRPNDAIVRSDGTIYFTDPGGTTGSRSVGRGTVCGVYRVSPDLGTMSLIVADWSGRTASPSLQRSASSTSPTRGAGSSAPTILLPNGTVAADEPGCRRPGRRRDGRARRHKGRHRRQRLQRRCRRSSTSWTRPARSSGGSCTVTPRRPMSPSAATIGRRSTSRRGAR